MPPSEIVCTRRRFEGPEPFDGEIAEVSIPQAHKHHSPTGYEWGYLGSGPADLALNILALFLPLDRAPARSTPEKLWDGTKVSLRAFQLHQYFKRDMIATIPHDGGVLAQRDIVNWLAGYGVHPEEIAFDEQ